MEEALATLEEAWDSPHGNSSETDKKLHKWVMALVAVVKSQTKQIKDLQTQLAEAKKVNDNGGTGCAWTSIVRGGKPSDQTQALIATVNKEISEKARLENNVTITGLGIGKDEDEDIEKVNQVLKALNIDRSTTVKRQRRIKSSNSGDNSTKKVLDMIVVEFKDDSARLKALRDARTLRSTAHKNVYINPDKTASERALERELRKRRNELNAEFPESQVRTGSEGRHRYGIKPQGVPNAGEKFYYGIRWNEIKEIYFERS